MLSCQTSTSLVAATYPVTATYTGDANDNGGVATGASFVVTQAGTSMTESAAPATIAFGMQDTLAAAGLPGDATGTVTFASGGSTLCVATLPAMSCLTASTLPPGTYPVTATYSGDSNYTGVIASGASFTVTKEHGHAHRAGIARHDRVWHHRHGFGRRTARRRKPAR